MKKVMKKVIAAALTVSVAATMLTTGAMTAQAETSTGVGLAAHALTAYREGWQYVWGGTSYGTVDCSGLIYTYNYVGGNRVDMLGSSSTWGYVSDGVPRIHGLGLHTPGHVGVYIGSGMAVDARDEYWGVVYHNVYNASWVEWFKVAGVSYPENGWVLLDGDSFYYEDGQYIVSTSRTIDGVTYSFDSAGVSNIAPPSSAYEATDYSTATASQAEVYNYDDEEESSDEEEYSEEEEESQEEESYEEESSEEEEYIEESSEEEESEEEEISEEESTSEESVEEESYEEESEEESAEESYEEESSEEESAEEESQAEESYEDESTSEESVEEESVEEESVEEESVEEESVEEESVEEESSEESVEEESTAEESSKTEESKEEPAAEESKAEESAAEESKTEESYEEPVKEVKILAEYGDQDYDDNNYVARAQKKLYELGYYDFKPTGYFDEETIYAVMRFQSMNDLEITGRVDEETLKALESKDAVSSFVDLYLGDYDAFDSGRIAALQNRLTELEYFYGEVSGYYGEMTAKAVEQFQIDNNMDVTGNADVAVQLLMFKTDAKHNPNAGCVAYGMQTDETGKVIARLAQLRYLAIASGDEFTDEVLEAVHMFQKMAGFEESDTLTPEMLELLYSENAPLSPEYNNLRVGYKGDDVADLQSKLAMLKYYDGKNSGIFTADVAEAVKKFQADNNMDATGIADTLTIERIETAITKETNKTADELIIKTAAVADDALSNIAKSAVKTPAAATTDVKTSVSNDVPSSTNDPLPIVGLAGAFLALSTALIALIIGKRKKSNEILRGFDE